jgi:hypothetical protein
MSLIERAEKLNLGVSLHANDVLFIKLVRLNDERILLFGFAVELIMVGKDLKVFLKSMSL